MWIYLTTHSYLKRPRFHLTVLLILVQNLVVFSISDSKPVSTGLYGTEIRALSFTPFETGYLQSNEKECRSYGERTNPSHLNKHLLSIPLSYHSHHCSDPVFLASKYSSRLFDLDHLRV
jgi:hypothetical protein